MDSDPGDDDVFGSPLGSACDRDKSRTPIGGISRRRKAREAGLDLDHETRETEPAASEEVNQAARHAALQTAYNAEDAIAALQASRG